MTQSPSRSSAGAIVPSLRTPTGRRRCSTVAAPRGAGQGPNRDAPHRNQAVRDQRGRGACWPAPGLTAGSTCRLEPWVAGTARQFGDARAGNPTGQRQRCSGDVKPTAGRAVAPRRSRLGHETVEDVHEAGQPRHYRWRGQASSAGSCRSVDCGWRRLWARNGTPRRPALPDAYGSLATVSRTAESSSACNVCRALGTIRRSPSRPFHSVASATSRTRPPVPGRSPRRDSRAPTAPTRRSTR
jgi:hypothetical protein